MRSFPPEPLRQYALLADGERGALVGPRGDIAFMCAPRWHDEGVFSSLIGGEGHYAVTPADPRFMWGGHYEAGSLIWRSRWVTTDGIIECREALAYPGDSHRAVLMRRLIAARGDACAELTFAPAAGFGRHGMKHLVRDDRGCWRAHCGELRVTVHGASHAVIRHAHGKIALCADLKVPEGDYHDIVVELSDRPSSEPLPDADDLWASTEKHWEADVPALDGSVTPRDARHSYAVLRGLANPGGGMVAAATMSLPERAEQSRNYDYRYVWIRDQCYAGQAVACDGPHPLLDDAVSFVGQQLLADGPDLKPVYTLDGGAVPDERSLRLPGYPGVTDVLGNHAHAQFQLDAFGEALLLFAAAARHDRLDSERYRAVTAAVDAIKQRWREPDAGIWELDERRWTHSRLTCVAGLRAIAAHATTGDAVEFSALAEAIASDAADCVHPSGRWQRAPDDDRVDAALLAPVIRGAFPPDDRRGIATLRGVVTDLDDDGYVYRFRHDDQPLAKAEGAFLLCGFWTALAHQQLGDTASALRYFERNRAACGPPGLFGEEYDVEQRQLRGNLPQAFV